MCSPSDFDQEINRLLLAGSREEVAQAIDLIHEHYSRRVAGLARKWFPGLSAHDLADAWEATLENVATRALQKQHRADGSIRHLLLLIMRRRCSDHLRRVRGRREELGSPELQRCIDSDDPTANAVCNEMFDVLWEAAQTLPTRQRQVWTVYIQLGLQASIADLIHAVWATYGEVLSPDAVRRALQNGRPKMRSELRRRGFDL